MKEDVMKINNTWKILVALVLFGIIFSSCSSRILTMKESNAEWENSRIQVEGVVSFTERTFITDKNTNIQYRLNDEDNAFYKSFVDKTVIISANEASTSSIENGTEYVLINVELIDWYE
jgi:hypothetical protein